MLVLVTLAFAGERPGVILADPGHPLVTACTAALGAKRLEECVERTARRDHAADEVRACAAGSDPKVIEDCVLRLERRGAFDTSATIRACLSSFNKGALDCLRLTEPAVGDASSAVVGCADWVHDDRGALACIERFNGSAGGAGSAIKACMEHFGDDGDKCVDRIARAQGPMEGVVTECAVNHPGDPSAGLGCIERFATTTLDAGPGIKACGEAFRNGDRCLDLVARASGAQQNVIPACRSIHRDDGDALGCIGRFATTTADGGPGILACAARMGDYRDECITRIGAAAGPMEGVIEGCADLLEGKLAMKCVAVNVAVRNANRASIAACGELFTDPGDRLRCAELGSAKDASKLQACLAWPKDRMGCVER